MGEVVVVAVVVVAGVAVVEARLPRERLAVGDVASCEGGHPSGRDPRRGAWRTEIRETRTYFTKNKDTKTITTTTL